MAYYNVCKILGVFFLWFVNFKRKELSVSYYQHVPYYLHVAEDENSDTREVLLCLQIL